MLPLLSLKKMSIHQSGILKPTQFHSWCRKDWIPEERWTESLGSVVLSSSSFSVMNTRTVHDLQWFNLMMWKAILIHRNHTSRSEFWSFPRLAICSKILCWCWAVAAATAPTDHAITRVNWPTHLESFWLSLPVWCSVTWDIQHCVIK